MRRANPRELRTRAVPVITARITDAELKRWFPVSFDDITDPLAVPEPSKGALIQLEGGTYVVVYYGTDSKQLFLEIPETTPDASALVAEFFYEVPLPTSRVLWHRSDIALPKLKQRAAPSKRDDPTARGQKERSTGTDKRSAKRMTLPKRQK